jgi:hypothetical protein
MIVHNGTVGRLILYWPSIFSFFFKPILYQCVQAKNAMVTFTYNNVFLSLKLFNFLG